MKVSAEGWDARRLKVGDCFLEYKAMFEIWFTDQLQDQDSTFKRLEKEVEKFDDKFAEVMAELEEQDKNMNLFTLEDRPASLIKYPSLEGRTHSVTDDPHSLS